ncbi:MAG: NADH-quinone oxidoreductase subunit L [Phycisphaeraceae bacterium]
MPTLAAVNMDLIRLAAWIPFAPLLGLLVCAFIGILPAKKLRVLTAPVAIAAVATSLVLSICVWIGMGDIASFQPVSVHAFQWIHAGSFSTNISFFIDPLTIVMLMVVTGVGTLIFIYASGYMAGDPGYFRFFAYFCIFILAMTLLVLADNLVLLYLGWEGVGLASYLLIGFYYRKPSAVAAAKKAFIVNRVGDFGFALGIMLTFLVFGQVAYSDLILPNGAANNHELIAGFAGTWKHNAILWIPFLLMLGAFGKSAQLPLHVWLPDAMEGPTPVSALIHAATMVTAGVYMIARLLPIFQLSPHALPTVAIVGGITAIFAATIALCQYDIKRIWAYSTVSQLGYMFLGVGVLGTTGAIFHLFTHAFFKALLFLTAGSVMHALAGQLDLRKMSGLFKKMPVTAILMLCGCLALAGVPFTSGNYSKDTILAHALVTTPWLGWLGIGTALLTAFYTFRLWFRVFMGPTEYVMGHEHHGYEMAHAPDDHHHGPHEMPLLMNGPLIVLAIGALLLGWYVGPHTGWMEEMISHSTAAIGRGHFSDPGVSEASGSTQTALEHAHHTAATIAGYGAIVMILLAGYFHWINRNATAKIAAAFAPVVTLLNHKYYIDELYDLLIVKPLRGLGWVCYLVIDKLFLDGIVYDGLLQHTPKIAAEAQAPTQRGKLQGFAAAMAFGLLLILAVVVYAMA